MAQRRASPFPLVAQPSAHLAALPCTTLITHQHLPPAQVYAQPLFVLIEWEIWVKLLKHRTPRRPHSVTSATAPRIHSALTAAQAAGSARQESATSMAGAAGEAGAAPADFHLQMSPFDNHKVRAFVSPCTNNSQPLPN